MNLVLWQCDCKQKQVSHLNIPTSLKTQALKVFSYKPIYTNPGVSYKRRDLTKTKRFTQFLKKKSFVLTFQPGYLLRGGRRF